MKKDVVKMLLFLVCCLFVTVGCSSKSDYDLIKQDSAEHAGMVSTINTDKSVKFASPTPSPTPIPTYIPDESFGKAVETKEDYIEYAEWAVLRKTKFYLINTRSQKYNGKDSMGISYDVAGTVTVVCELPDYHDVLLDNKYELEYKDIVNGLTFETLYSHGMSWQEPAIANEVFEKFSDGLTKYAVVRSTMLGIPQRSKIIIYAKLNGKQYLHGVEDENLNLNDMSKFGSYGVVRTNLGDYYLYGGLVNMQISPLGTSVYATFAFTDFSSEYNMSEEDLKHIKVKGKFTSDTEGKLYDSSLSFNINNIRVSELGTFFATFEFPMQGSTSSLQERIRTEFEPSLYNERDELLATFSIATTKED